MKTSCVIILVLLFASVHVGCGEVNSVSGDYQKTLSSKDALPKKEKAKGDADKGKTLLKTCAGCHDTGVTKLNSTAIAKLPDAYPGKMAATHETIKASFEGQNRLDLEAALTAIAAP